MQLRGVAGRGGPTARRSRGGVPKRGGALWTRPGAFFQHLCQLWHICPNLYSEWDGLSSCSILWYNVQIAQWPHFLSRGINVIMIIKVVFMETFFQPLNGCRDGWHVWSCQKAGWQPLHRSFQVTLNLLEIVVVVVVTSSEMSLWSLDGAWLSLLECLPLESTLQGKDIGSFPNFNPKVAADK